MGVSICIAICTINGVNGANDGLAIKPPMGWRNWNAYHADINQELFIKVVDAFVVVRNKLGRIDNSIGSDGDSLHTLGYARIGVDDGYQPCGKGYNHSFHDIDGTLLINTTLFPSMKEITKYGQSKGIEFGWYHNNCICQENGQIHGTDMINNHYIGDVLATLNNGFTDVKLDGCGDFLDLQKWYDLFAQYSGKKGQMLIENCHWGYTIPTQDWCPFHFYRTSGDIQPDFLSVMYNLQSTITFLDDHQPLSRPGCWAYPDMMQVGNLANEIEDRTNFGAWCIISSPLILSYDVLNEELNERVWPIISNKHAIRINQDYAGHPGRFIHSIGYSNAIIQIWAKPLSIANNNSVAILFINQDDIVSNDVQINLSSTLGINQQVMIFDVWDEVELHGTYNSIYIQQLKEHDSAFYILKPTIDINLFQLICKAFPSSKIFSPFPLSYETK